MKRSPGKIFAKVFIRSIFVVLFLLTVAVISYKAAMHFWQPKEKGVVAYQDDTVSTDKVKVEIEAVSKNLIFCYDEESNDITKIVLEILNGHSRKLTYITIPVRTKITIDDPLYRKIILDCPEMPQFMKLSALSAYLDADKAFEYGVLITENLLGIDINYYTVFPVNTYETIFTQKYIKQEDNYASVPMETFTKDYTKYIKTLDTKEKVTAYIEETYPSIKTNLALDDKVKFLRYYMEVSPKDISFELIKGRNINSEYTIDLEHTGQQLVEHTATDTD